MGAAHSRARPGTGPTKGGLRGFKNDPDGAGPNDASRNDYFILCLKNGEKTDKIKVVNAAGSVHKMLTTIIKRNMVILKSGWDRHLVFSYKLQKSPRGRHALIQLTAELLLTLYRLGWEPMTPIDLPGPKTTSTDNGVTVVNLQTAICFRRKNNNLSQEHLANNWTPTPSYNTSCDDISMLYPNTMGVERHDCLCLETYSENFLGFHDVPNTLLLDLVQCMSSDWQPGLTGISAAVYSVISDYCSMDSQYPVLPGSMADDRRYLQLKGSPWSQSEEGEDLEDAICAENLTLSLIACLAKSQYKLQISINMDSKTRVFFFIKDKETKEIRLPSVGVGLGDKNSLYVHPTTITRTQTSFFRSRSTALCTGLLRDLGITGVLNAAQGSMADWSYVNTKETYYTGVQIKFLGVPAIDLKWYPLCNHFEEACHFIDCVVKSGGNVLVHCVQGISRSATLVLAYLIMRKQMTIQQAFHTVRSCRSIGPNEGFIEQLIELNDNVHQKQQQQHPRP